MISEQLSDAEERAARRARRDARRQEQRRTNVLRAAKMHEARLTHERESVDAPIPSNPRAHNIVGCSGWYYWHWKGCFYPSTLPGSEWFAHYAATFRTVELNAPFYSWPTLKTVETWSRQARQKRSFVYTIKVNELITHERRFVRCKTLVRDFGLIADLLGPRFGCFLFQLPPSFHYTPALLRRVLGALDHRRRNVVEFRHKSWWNDTVFAAFREAGTIFCSTSGPRLPDEIVRTADDIYVRFHGVRQWYRHDYSRDELRQWAAKIRAAGARRVWVYFNNDRDGHAIHNAKTLRNLLK